MKAWNWVHVLIVIGVLLVAWHVGRNFARSGKLRFLEGVENMEPTESPWSKFGFKTDTESAETPAESGTGSGFSFDTSKFSTGNLNPLAARPVDVDNVLLQLNSMIVRDQTTMNLPATKAKYEELLVKVDDYVCLQGLLAAGNVRNISSKALMDTLQSVDEARRSLNTLLQYLRRL